MNKKWKSKFLFLMPMYIWFKKLIIIELAINAPAKTIPLILKIRLFVNADKYCKIDIWPNLKCRFEAPIMIFSSLSRFIYGKWYKPASGLYMLLFVISKKIINAEKEQNIK